MQDHVGVVAEVGVEGVVLQVGRVEVLACEFIAAVLSDDPFEVLHGEEVGVVPAGCLEGDREGAVQHLVVSLVDEGRSEVGFVAVGHLVDPEGGD